MSFYNIMRYSTRLIVARHGFETVTLKLAENYRYYANLLSRHGISLNPRLVDEELAEIKQSNHDPKVIRRILEARPATKAAESRTQPIKQLNQTLAKLDSILNDLSNSGGNGQQRSVEEEAASKN
jgi:hypothetical protein